MNINIFEANPIDAKLIQEINSKTWLHTYKNEELWINDELLKRNPTSDNNKKIYLKRKGEEIKQNPGSYFIVKDWEKVIWYASWKIHKNKSYNELFAIYILPEYHKKWIWKKLAQNVFNYLWDKKDIIVTVIWYNNNAILFYENLWFIFSKKIDDFEIVNWIFVSEIQMIKK